MLEHERAPNSSFRAVDWHAVGIEHIYGILDTGPEGLAEDDAVARAALSGRNELPRAEAASFPVIFLRQFRSPLIYLLLAALALSFIVGRVADAVFILAAVLINAVIGAIQESKAEKGAEALSGIIPIRVTVRRGGRLVVVDSKDLVPGDIVLLESGVRVPADLRLFSAAELSTDESSLTGESLPVEKDAAALLPAGTPVADRKNMAFAGTTIMTGRAEGIVAATGLGTELGRIAEALAAPDAAVPPLIVRLRRLARLIGGLVIVVVTVLATAEALRGMPIQDVVIVAVALAVSVIPEGLPVAITVALSVGRARMTTRNVIIRSLPAVEGLGACDVIASDKTGTLTQNRLTVTRVDLADGRSLSATGHSDSGDATFQRLLLAGALCNEASLRWHDGRDQHVGDTVDIAFLMLARANGLHWEDLRDRHPRVALVPYEPHRKFAASFNRIDDQIVASVKGAAEIVVPMCRDVDSTALLAQAERIAGEGYRVLALAQGAVMSPTPESLSGLVFLGYAGLIDPLRPEAADAIATARCAGVDVRMVTGDHPATALAIGRELGFADTGASVLTGADIAALAAHPERLDRAVSAASIFARVEPVQKLAIVQSLQRQGHFVAVTGDGVNDAPALHAAQIGVAMGQMGTDAARDASDLILADDNFASIVAGIEEGRIAYDNVRKVIYFLISTGAAELVLFALSMAAGLPIPLFAAQLLWLNLVTGGIQDMALAFERGEPGILRRPPRSPHEGIFDRRLVEETTVASIYMGLVAFVVYWWALNSGRDEGEARNLLLLSLVLLENVQVFNSRSEWRSTLSVPIRNNTFLVLATLGAHGTHIAAMFIPGLSGVLGISPVSPAEWLVLAAGAFSLIIVMEIYKWSRPAPWRS